MIFNTKETLKSNLACQEIKIEVIKSEYREGSFGFNPTIKTVVKRNPGGEEILKIRFILDDKVINPDSDSANDLKEFDSKEFIFSDVSPANVGGIDLTTGEHKIRAAPIIILNNKEVVCTEAISAPFEIIKISS
jgi:hypothetical protein